MKKTHIFFLILFCISSQDMIAQNQVSRLMIGISTGLNLARPMLVSTDSQSPYLTKSFLGYSIGLEARYQLKNRFILQTGLYFTRKSYQQSLSLSVFYSQNNMVIYDGFSYSEFNDLEIPIIFRYKVSKKYNLDFGMGAVLGFGQKTIERVSYPQAPQYNNTYNPDFLLKPPHRLHLHLSASYTHSIKDKYFVGIEPYFQYDLNAIFVDVGFEHYSYGFRTFFLIPTSKKKI